MSVTPMLRRLTQKYEEFEASQGYCRTPYLKKKKKKKQANQTLFFSFQHPNSSAKQIVHMNYYKKEVNENVIIRPRLYSDKALPAYVHILSVYTFRVHRGSKDLPPYFFNYCGSYWNWYEDHHQVILYCPSLATNLVLFVVVISLNKIIFNSL
jgi:hypothetical protein